METREAMARESVLWAMMLVVLGVAFVVGDKRGDALHKVSEYRDSVETLNDSIDRLESTPDTLTVIVESASKYNITPTLARKVLAHAKKEGVDPRVAFDLVQQESSFRSDVYSDKNAIGLTQIRPSTAQSLDAGITVAQLYNPDTNLKLGFRYLRKLLERYGSYHKALQAYNIGPTNYDDSIHLTSGREYANDVLRQ